MVSISTKPSSVRAAQALFFLNALIWLAFGAIFLARMAGSDGANSVTLLVITVLMFGNVIAMLIAGLGLGKQNRPFYFLALAVLAVLQGAAIIRVHDVAATRQALKVAGAIGGAA